MALAVGYNIDYAVLCNGDNAYIIADNLIDQYTQYLGNNILSNVIKGKDLIGINYYPLFPYFAQSFVVYCLQLLFFFNQKGTSVAQQS